MVNVRTVTRFSMTRARATAQRALVVAVIVTTMLIGMTSLSTMCANRQLLVRAFVTTRTVSYNARMERRRTCRSSSSSSTLSFSPSTDAPNGRLPPFRNRLSEPRIQIRASSSEEAEEEALSVTENVSTTTPFANLFQSTLQRAYSTTATLASIKSNEMDTSDASTSTNVDAAVNSILDATIVETTSNDDDDDDSSKETKERIVSTVDSLLDATLTSARDKNSNRPSSNEESQEMVESLLDATKYAKRTHTQKQRQTQQHHSKTKDNARYEFPFCTSYKSHPALNNVALAHALWASVVRPNSDVVIDATCGNGNDSIVLAEILFGNSNPQQVDQTIIESTTSLLLCLDVQSLACERTTLALKEVLPESIQVIGPNDDNDNDDDNDNASNGQQVVKVLNASHERLPRPQQEVGLVVYNLGWLPSGSKDCVTTSSTTMASLVDAVGLLRVGGMLSVVTYPQTSPEEHEAVKLFVTCLGLLSSKTRTWQEEVATMENAEIASLVTSAMEAVDSQQTWRVSQHDRLGMDRPPVLFTATRIK